MRRINDGQVNSNCSVNVNRGETIDEREDQHGYAEAEELNKQHATGAASIG